MKMNLFFARILRATTSPTEQGLNQQFLLTLVWGKQTIICIIVIIIVVIHPDACW